MKVTINSGTVGETERRMMRRNYALACILRDETNLMVKMLPDAPRVGQIIRGSGAGCTYHLATHLNTSKDAVMSYEEAEFYSRRIPQNIGSIRKLRETYEREIHTINIVERKWSDSVSAFLNNVHRLRGSMRVLVDDSDKRTSRVLAFEGKGRNTNMRVNLAASWLFLTNKIGSAIVNKDCVVLTARQIFDYEDGLVLYEGTVLDIANVKERHGYICSAKIGDTFVGCFNESLGRAVGMSRSRISSSVMNALAG